MAAVPVTTTPMRFRLSWLAIRPLFGSETAALMP